MHLDRLITLRLVQPWQRFAADPSPLPILMYHRIAADAEPQVPSFRRLCTSPARFRAQMQWLAAAGWRGVCLSEALASGPFAAGRRVCAITFDDGLRDFLTGAAPVLASHGFRATVYLPTAFIDEPHARFQSHECLTWPDIRDLHRGGIEFGSHTVNHPRLHELPWCDMWRELAASKARIEAELGTSVAGFSFPYAFPQASRAFACTAASLLRVTGYSHAVTTVIGCARRDDARFFLKRLPVSEADDRELFLAKLGGAYDWLAHPQSWAKTARHLLGAPA